MALSVRLRSAASRRIGGTVIALALVLLAAPACGHGGPGAAGTVLVGTTEVVRSFDPAAIEPGTWTPVYNIYQRLLHYEPGRSTPTPDAAESCAFTGSDDRSYECVVRPGQTFSNGRALTAHDVVYSFRRILAIDGPRAATGPLTVIDSVRQSGHDTVVFTLRHPFPAFPDLLATARGSIVDAHVFPPDKLLGANEVVGSGPYRLDRFVPGREVDLAPNPDYGGEDQVENSGITVRFYGQEATLDHDLASGAVDVAAPIADPVAARRQVDPDVRLDAGPGGAVGALRFAGRSMPGGSPAGRLAVRKAVALSVARGALARAGGRGTVLPLYSPVPIGVAGHLDAFRVAYGAAADPARARRVLSAAKVTLPVPLQVWYGATTPATLQRYRALARQLAATGLFRIRLRRVPTGAAVTPSATRYAVLESGWSPPYPAAEAYLAPVGAVPAGEPSAGPSDAQERRAAAHRRQRAVARQVPMVPLWQSRRFALQRKGITGVSESLGVCGALRYWLLGR